MYQLAVHWGEKESDLLFEDKETAEVINLMAENHFLKERKKAKKERKPVGQPVGAKVQGWSTNPKTKMLNWFGEKQSGGWATCPGLAVCLVLAFEETG
nr:hypothetical protein [Sunxiuqinia sp.]